ncbi:PstS family phosphate ABC transporter substrate-binding protein [Panacibacter sp. DH6]|uniref:PstS family phosphate ABC transporter substrate-binding protein n=1 Tax=Panacibacter microcysteis TaxID=2793269 RepID=A0A931E6G8_9BACT|nr:PstS family phosphate ABC transporter substrate-binding protein [Panacibacter microcysteis]MBG9376356.1 PstS family phosphate ABC transporter substrate-binding protein [Panacibacter microcysteis]
MKKTILVSVTALAALFTNFSGKPKDEPDPEPKSVKAVSISFSGAFALYPLVQTWAAEYNKIHPEIRFDIQAGGAGKGLTDCLSGSVDVGMFSRELSDAEKAKGVWTLALCRDAVIPTYNAKNANSKSIQIRGVKKAEFNSIFVDKSITTWESLLGINTKSPHKINVYTRADAAGAADSWAAFFGKKQENLKGIGVSGDPGVADAVRKDLNAIGYNNTLFVYDAASGKKLPGIDVVPIDVNGNGTIDADENFYGNLRQFLKAVNDGKYPSPPARNLYFITKGKTQKKEILDFFKWVLTDGQKYVGIAGYVQLPKNAVADQLKKLSK